MNVELIKRYGPHALLAISLLMLGAGLTINLASTHTTTVPITFTSSSADSPSGAFIQIHVAGAVISPGVVTLRPGDRVADAIAAAGGITDGADIAALNQARVLRDGEMLTVPGRAAAATGGASGSGLIDLNTASAAELDRLPGIGEAYSRRIVDSRTVDGPFAGVEDLAARRILPANTLETIKPYIAFRE